MPTYQEKRADRQSYHSSKSALQFLNGDQLLLLVGIENNPGIEETLTYLYHICIVLNPQAWLMKGTLHLPYLFD